MKGQKVIVVGAGPVGSLAALYAAKRGADVEIYELRSGKSKLQSADKPENAADSMDSRPSKFRNDTTQLHKIHQSRLIRTRH